MHYLTLTLHPAVDRIVDVERWIPGGTFDGRLRDAVPAGKGVNTARSLRCALGPRGRITAATWLGASEAGFYNTRLQAEQIASLPCTRACATRIATTILDAEGVETHVKEHMPPPTIAETRALLRFCERLPLKDSVVAVCGSAPNDTPPKVLARVLATLRARARVLVADTNGPFLEAAGRAGLNGIKGNAAEVAAWLRLSHPFDPDRAVHRNAMRNALRPVDAKASVRKAPCTALVTLGKDGAFIASVEGCWRVRPPELPKGAGGCATGCGDAATAGWIWGLGEGLDPAETLRKAVACGTAKYLNEDPGRIDPKVLRRLWIKTKAEKLE